MKLFSKIFSIILILTIVATPVVPVFVPTAYAQTSGGGGILQQSAGPIVGAAVGCAIGKLSGLLTSKIDVTVVGVSDAATQSIDNNVNCLKKVARAVSQILLKKMTIATVNWINSGFKGEPAYVKNPGSLFKSIADDEINGLTAQLAIISPFGRAIARNLILSTQGYFARNAAYSLNKVMAMGQIERFQADFSVGGWDAWLATVLRAENNPIGASFIASDELAIRLTGSFQPKSVELQEELKQFQGFLSLKTCADPTDYQDPSKDPSFTTTSATTTAYGASNGAAWGGAGSNSGSGIGGSLGGGFGGNNQGGDQAAAKEWLRRHTCKRWETSTPGGVIANELTQTLNIPRDSLINSEDLDTSLTAIFDALFNQLIGKGLDSLADDTAGNNGNVQEFGGYGSNTSQTTIPSGGTGVSGQWFNSNPGFNFNTDIPRVINDQRDYLTQLRQEAIALQSVLGAIYQADFCLPGPHTGWQQDAQTKLSNLINTIDIDKDDGKDGARGHYAKSFFTITGAVVDPDVNIQTYSKLIRAIQRVFQGGLDMDTSSTTANTFIDGYVQKINAKFNLNTLPVVARQINSLYNKATNYQAGSANVDSQIGDIEAIITQLQYIQSQIGTISPTSSQYQILLNSFQGLAPDLATQADVANIKGEIIQINTDVTTAGNLTQECIAEVNAPSYTGPKERMPYPGIQNIYNFPTVSTVSNFPLPLPTFLPEYGYGYLPGGAPATTEIHITDAYTLLPGPTAGSSSTNFQVVGTFDPDGGGPIPAIAVINGYGVWVLESQLGIY